MKHLMFAILGLTLISSPAFAAKHCVGKDGREISVAKGTAKARANECRANGGRWQKMRKHAAK
jgi:hypothetical protein